MGKKENMNSISWDEPYWDYSNQGVAASTISCAIFGILITYIFVW